MRCANCRRKGKRPLMSENEGLIKKALLRAKVPLLGREIAERAGLPFNSHFRPLLARLVLSGDIEKLPKKQGYRPVRQEMS